MSYQTQIDTSALTDQDISSELLVHTYTNTTRVRLLRLALDIDEVAGNGDYVLRVTIQRSGAGTVFDAVPSTTITVGSGVTEFVINSREIILNATDVLKVYLTGVAGDTTTPNITTRVFEELALDTLGSTAPTDWIDNNAIATDALTADSVSADFIGASEIAESAGQEIADLIAQDIQSGDLSAVAFAEAVRTELATELARIDAAITSRMASYTQPTGFLAATFPSIVGTTAPTAEAIRAEIDSASTQLTALIDTTSYSLAVLAGTISTAADATGTYELTINGSDYSVVVSGLDSDGNRTGQTLSKE